jgi:hypothetical protein
LRNAKNEELEKTDKLDTKIEKSIQKSKRYDLKSRLHTGFQFRNHRSKLENRSRYTLQPDRGLPTRISARSHCNRKKSKSLEIVDQQEILNAKMLLEDIRKRKLPFAENSRREKRCD